MLIAYIFHTCFWYCSSFVTVVNGRNIAENKSVMKFIAGINTLTFLCVVPFFLSMQAHLLQKSKQAIEISKDQRKSNETRELSKKRKIRNIKRSKKKQKQ